MLFMFLLHILLCTGTLSNGPAKQGNKFRICMQETFHNWIQNVFTVAAQIKFYIFYFLSIDTLIKLLQIIPFFFIMGTQVSDLHVYELLKCLNRGLEHADDLHIIQEKQKEMRRKQSARSTHRNQTLLGATQTTMDK